MTSLKPWEASEDQVRIAKDFRERGKHKSDQQRSEGEEKSDKHTLVSNERKELEIKRSVLAIENKRGKKKERHEYVRANHPGSLFLFHFRFKRRIKPPNKFHRMQQIRGRIFSKKGRMMRMRQRKSCRPC